IRPISELLEMDFESGSLFGRIIFRSPQCDYRIQRILTAGSTTLPTIFPRVVGEENSDSLPSKSPQPIFHWDPSVARTLTASRAQCGKIVQYQQIDVVQQWFQRTLSFLAPEIDSALHTICSKNTKSFIWNPTTQSEGDGSESLLQGSQWHLAIDI